MKDQEFAQRVRRCLDSALDALPPAVRARLRASREAALAHARGVDSARTVAGAAAVARSSRWGLNVRSLAPVAGVLLMLAGVLLWQQYARQVAPLQHADFADVDTEVLTDTLPVVAYLDPGFEIWLYHHTAATAED